MQMSLPCPLFVAGNLISSRVATIQTGGMWRMLPVTHGRGRRAGALKHFISQQVSTCCRLRGPIRGSISGCMTTFVSLYPSNRKDYNHFHIFTVGGRDVGAGSLKRLLALTEAANPRGKSPSQNTWITEIRNCDMVNRRHCEPNEPTASWHAFDWTYGMSQWELFPVTCEAMQRHTNTCEQQGAKPGAAIGLRTSPLTRIL